MRSGSQAREVLPRISPILEALGPASFAEFQAVTQPGTILWCNFELLRELGFDVPQTNQLTPEDCLSEAVFGEVNHDSCVLPDGGVELERRTIRGISYSVLAWDDRAQTRRVHVSVHAIG